MKSLKFENWLQLIVCQKTCLILYPSLENSTTGIAIFKGKQEVYEISLICQDMSSIEVFIVPEAMKNDTATLEALGFTLNRNLNKYFYVQSGTGMLNSFFALEKLFLTLPWICFSTFNSFMILRRDGHLKILSQESNFYW